MCLWRARFQWGSSHIQSNATLHDLFMTRLTNHTQGQPFQAWFIKTNIGHVKSSHLPAFLPHSVTESFGQVQSVSCCSQATLMHKVPVSTAGPEGAIECWELTWKVSFQTFMTHPQIFDWLHALWRLMNRLVICEEVFLTCKFVDESGTDENSQFKSLSCWNVCWTNNNTLKVWFCLKSPLHDDWIVSDT